MKKVIIMSLFLGGGYLSFGQSSTGSNANEAANLERIRKNQIKNEAAEKLVNQQAPMPTQAKANEQNSSVTVGVNVAKGSAAKVDNTGSVSNNGSALQASTTAAKTSESSVNSTNTMVKPEEPKAPLKVETGKTTTVAVPGAATQTVQPTTFKSSPATTAPSTTPATTSKSIETNAGATGAAVNLNALQLSTGSGTPTAAVAQENKTPELIKGQAKAQESVAVPASTEVKQSAKPTMVNQTKD